MPARERSHSCSCSSRRRAFAPKPNLTISRQPSRAPAYRRRVRRRQRARPRARRRHPLVRGASHPDRPGRRHQHGRADRRRLRVGHVAARAERSCSAETDWDEMFGFSPFRYKNMRRKDDARDYPSRIEFGLKRGIVPPLALNNGQQVDFLLARIAGPYRHAHELRRSADAVPRRRRRSRHGAAGRPRPRLARRRDARDDVAARHLSAGGDATAGCWSTAAR